jgi:hypothetical protein
MTKHSVSRATEFDSQSNFLVYITYLTFTLLLLLLPGAYIYSDFEDNIDNIQLFWLSAGLSDYTEKESSVQCALLDGEWHTYRFPIVSEQFPISKLRLDFVREFSVAATVEVRAIQSLTADFKQTSRIEFEEIECSGCRVIQHSGLLSIDQIEFDPFAQFSAVPPLTTAIDIVQLEMRIEPGRINPLSWFMRKAETGTFNSACRLANIEDN